MGLKILLSFLFFLLVVFLLSFYWFIPVGTSVFTITSDNSNFSAVTNSSLQFYPNMRYSNPNISYSIDEYCTLKKKEEMKRAFDIIIEKTILNFYELKKDAEISVKCDSKSKIEEGLFIAGEGGPTNITVAGDYNVISKGNILLIRSSNCGKPNIALHELLHTLGFDHSTNKNNVMYPVTSCTQTIGDDVISMINKLYSIPSYPDLVFENVSAVMHGSYLDIDMNIRNNGLIDATSSNILISADDNLIKTIKLEPVEIGRGRGISLTNVWAKKRNVKKITLLIDSGFNELNYENNKIELQVKDI